MWYINEAVELSQSLVSLWKKYLIAVYFCIQFIDTFLKWIVFKLHTKLQFKYYKLLSGFQHFCFVLPY